VSCGRAAFLAPRGRVPRRSPLQSTVEERQRCSRDGAIRRVPKPLEPMIHNPLVVAGTTLPWLDVERRPLGLPSGPRGSVQRQAKAALLYLRLESLERDVASRLGRLMVAAGGSFETDPGRGPRTSTLLLGGDGTAFARFVDRAGRAGRLGRPASEARDALQCHLERPRALALRAGSLPLLDGPHVMGILNLTPDSFSDGGRFPGIRRAVDRALRMAEEGARIVDVGGESTRPGSRPVPLEEEIRRVMPVIERLVPALARLGRGRPLLSIDTTKAEVARRAVAAGADLVNDISGLSFDPAMAAAVAEPGVPVVISHIRKTPRTMTKPPRYRHLLPEIAAFLRRQVALALAAGVRRDRILIDPGIGFGKKRWDNLVVLRHLATLRSLGHPILIGASRKSFIGGTLELAVADRLEGSLAAEALAIAGGADIIRAHDVRAAARVAFFCSAVLRGARRRRRGGP
jgi:dihydropteroate synthase